MFAVLLHGGWDTITFAILVWLSPFIVLFLLVNWLMRDKNTRLQDVPWYVWLFYTVGIVAFFTLLVKQVWWYFAASSVLFIVGSYFLHRATKRRFDTGRA